jgi:hypothetical protein
VEKILSDQAIQVELDIYNRLLPEVGELSATLFIELTSDGSMRDWLPRLVGIESALGVEVEVEVGGGGERQVVRSVPETAHAAALVRENVTPAVHYLRFAFTPAQVEAFAGPGEVALVAEHPEYAARTVLPPEVREELLGDLRGTTKPLPIG